MVAFGGFDCWLHHLITKREIDSLIDSTDNPQFTYLSIYDIYFQFQTMVSRMVWERTSSMVLVNRCSPLREVWRHFNKLAKFLDLNNRSWDWDGQLHRRTIEEKYRLRFFSLLQSCTEKSLHVNFFVFFPAKFAGPQFVEIQKRITLATWRNDFYSLLPKQFHFQPIKNLVSACWLWTMSGGIEANQKQRDILNE